MNRQHLELLPLLWPEVFELNLFQRLNVAMLSFPKIKKKTKILK